MLWPVRATLHDPSIRRYAPTMSYGTIMIGKLKTPGTGQALADAAKKWEERKVPGFQGSYALLSDDGTTVVSCVTLSPRRHTSPWPTTQIRMSGGGR